MTTFDENPKKLKVCTKCQLPILVDERWLKERLHSEYLRGRETMQKEASDELEKAFEECETLNLLHGAARVRSITP